jgi:hypothetical protein
MEMCVSGSLGMSIFSGGRRFRFAEITSAWMRGSESATAGGAGIKTGACDLLPLKALQFSTRLRQKAYTKRKRWIRGWFTIAAFHRPWTSGCTGCCL